MFHYFSRPLRGSAMPIAAPFGSRGCCALMNKWRRPMEIPRISPTSSRISGVFGGKQATRLGGIPTPGAIRTPTICGTKSTQTKTGSDNA